MVANVRTRDDVFLFDFVHKLKQLNSRLYVADRAVRMGERDHLGIYVKRSVRSETPTHLMGAAGTEEFKRLSEYAAGEVDEYVCGVTAGWVPEFPEFDPKTRHMVAKGWRAVLQELVRRKLISLSRARLIFTSSLGETDFDRLSFDEKRNLIVPVESVQDKMRKLAAANPGKFLPFLPGEF